MYVIGQRINPTGNKELTSAIREGNRAFVRGEALRQIQAGADALDVNVFVPGVNLASAMRMAVETIREAAREIPLAIDANDPDVLEAGLGAAGRKSFINSPLSARQTPKRGRILNLAKQFQPELIVLAMKGDQIPENSKETLEAGRLVLKVVEESGIVRARVILDAVLFSLKKAKEKVRETLESIKRIQGELGVRTVMGLSNISFGLKNREPLNARFLKLAKAAGLDYVICDPLQKEVMAVAREQDAEPMNPFERKEITEFLEFAAKQSS